MLEQLCDLTIVLFYCILSAAMISLKGEGRQVRLFRKIGYLLIILVAVGLTLSGWLPSVVSCWACMLFGGFVVLFPLSKYKGGRFFLPFVLVNTIGLILLFFNFYLNELVPLWGGVVAAVLLAILLMGLVFWWPILRKRTLSIGKISYSWGITSCFAWLAYGAMLFLGGFPSLPQVRSDVSSYAFFCIAVFSCYSMLLSSMLKAVRVEEQCRSLEKKQELYKVAYTDPLTNLYNSSFYTQKMQDFQQEKDRSYCFIVFDVNGFQTILRDHGRQAGDDVLRTVADRLKKYFFEQQDYVFRMDEDEFLVISVDTKEAVIQDKLKQLAAELNQTKTSFSDSLPLAMGYDFVEKDDTKQLSKALRYADQQMYYHKKQNE